MSACVFCERVARHEYFLEGPLAVAFPDRYPLSPGHTLIVPKAHAADYFDLAEAVQADLWRLVAEVKGRLDEEFSPAGYNVGINIGARRPGRRSSTSMCIWCRATPATYPIRAAASGTFCRSGPATGTGRERRRRQRTCPGRAPFGAP